MTTPDRALEYLYRELKRAKISLGQAENRPGVTIEELETLRNKILVLDYLTPLVLAAKEEENHD